MSVPAGSSNDRLQPALWGGQSCPQPPFRRLRSPVTPAPRLLYLLLTLTLLTPGIGQDEDQPYFSLSSTRTFASNSRPSVAMGAWNVDKLEFRVYRVHDAVKFFEQLEDSHQFGGHVPIPTHSPTLLERIHGWKHGVRASIRRSLRAQFTEPPSNHFPSLIAHTAQPIAPGTHYAEAPLLNPQQLVLAFVQPVHSTSRWESTPVNIDVKDKGVYLVEAVHKDLRAYTILMVSDIVSITKTPRNHITTFVADRATGQPIPGAQVLSVTHDGSKNVGETNNDGMLDFKPPAGQTAKSGQDIRILVRRGADFALTSTSSDTFGPDRDRLVAYTYTDRPVYRPGHTVHFRSVLRLRAPIGYEVPSSQTVSVQITDPDQKPVYQKSLTSNANGTISGELTLAPSASLGGYNIEIHSGDSQAGAEFEVQDYKKPEYEVRVTPATPRTLEGQSMQVTIDSRYYFGEPVPNAKVKYSVYKNRYWFPLWYDSDETPSDNPNGDVEAYADDNNQLSDEEGQLDQDGKLVVSIPTTVSEHGYDNVYRIEAHVTDEAKREITGSGWFLATYGSFVVNGQPDRYFYQTNSKAQITVQARDYDNKPVQTHARVELIIYDWRGNNASPQPTMATDVNTGPDGSAIAELNIPAQPGSYRVHVTAATPGGRTVQDDSYVWAAGRGDVDWFGGGQKTVQIVPDKKSYRPGDTAKILFITGKPGTPVLVSVEGRDLRSEQLIRSNTATAEFTLPVTGNDEPNIFVTAAFVRNGELYQNTKRIKVPPIEHTLNVKLSTDKPQYQPGQTGLYSLDVTGADGKPVPRADFSLGVVDEAIYAIRPDMTERILNFFYGHEWNNVITDSSLNYYFSGEAGKRRMRLAMLSRKARLAQLKPETLVQPKIRKAFPDTAFWDADILTDANGHATVKVPFPDSLTTWRATARGVTIDNKVGSATLKTIVRKNLILRLAVPRFFVQGDEVVISAIVHNYLTSGKTARVSLDMTGLDVIDGKTTDIAIPSRGEVKLDWRVRAKQVRQATITGKALTDEESDALELDLPVNPPGVQLSQSRGGSLANTASASFNLAFPDKVEPGSRALTIQVSPSIVGSLFGALDYLTSFPYGCVEQTMSSFLPDIVVKKAVQDLGVKSNVDEAALQEKIRSGLDRLYSFQHEDGGWGWWQTDETHPFMTAYVVAGLAQARDAGVQVNQDAIDKGAHWLQEKAVPDTNLAPDLRAYIAYALQISGQQTGDLPATMYNQRSKLSPYGLALIGLTLEGMKDSRVSEIATSLEQSAKQDDQQAWWPATRDALLDFSEDVTPEATAYVVKLLSHQRATSPLLPKAALWLMNHRSEGYWWSSTKQTAMVIYGLADYLKATHELNPKVTATVYVNDRPVLTKKFDSTSVGVDATIRLDETPSPSASVTPAMASSTILHGANSIRIASSGDGRVYYSARAEYFSGEKRLEKTGRVSLNVLRDYFRLTPTKQNDRVVYDLSPLGDTVSSGDILAVRLTVTGSEWRYLMVEDPIPAGTEFIEHDSSYQLKEQPPWWIYSFTRRELHDDHMAIFETYFPEGQTQYFYLLKVVNPGSFNVSPARVQPMYQPNFMATSESRRLEVK